MKRRMKKVAGKPRDGRKKALKQGRYVRLPAEIDEAIQRIAAREEREISWIIRQLIREGLEARVGIKLAS
jgi:hypothetical protein